MDFTAAVGVRNYVQKQTLQSSESLYNFFSNGLEEEWYTILPDVERESYSADF